MKPTNHISWDGLTGLGGSYSSALSPTPHHERCSSRDFFKQQCTGLAQLQHWPYVTSWQIRSPRQPFENNLHSPSHQTVRVSRSTSSFISKPILNIPEGNTLDKTTQAAPPPLKSNQIKPQQNETLKPSKHTVIIRKSIWCYTLTQKVSIEYHNWLQQTQSENY